MRHAIYLPPFGELADPRTIADLAHAADERGWDGFFVWDHVLSTVEGDWEISDPWIVLAAAAMVTDQIKLGPMVTPLPRRRVMKLARETVTLDRLSGGRLILGLGIGSDMGREYSAFGEDTNARRHGQLLDEGTAVLTQLWAGETVRHCGGIVVDGVRAIPGPVQQPRIPLWFATTRTTGRPVQRAARYDGIFPFGVDVAGIARIAKAIKTLRGSLDGFDIAVAARRDESDESYRAAGVTWIMHGFWPGDRPEQVLRLINHGKPDNHCRSSGLSSQ